MWMFILTQLLNVLSVPTSKWLNKAIGFKSCSCVSRRAHKSSHCIGQSVGLVSACSCKEEDKRKFLSPACFWTWASLRWCLFPVISVKYSYLLRSENILLGGIRMDEYPMSEQTEVWRCWPVFCLLAWKPLVFSSSPYAVATEIIAE